MQNSETLTSALSSEVTKLQQDITATVTWALKEDLGFLDEQNLSAEQDITASARLKI